MLGKILDEVDDQEPYHDILFEWWLVIKAKKIFKTKLNNPYVIDLNNNQVSDIRSEI